MCNMKETTNFNRKVNLYLLSPLWLGIIIHTTFALAPNQMHGFQVESNVLATILLMSSTPSMPTSTQSNHLSSSLMRWKKMAFCHT